MKDFSSTQIRARLAEIDQQQSTHQARDFDGELKAAMLAGGDVDALENQQLEAERVTRRLRVERAALEGSLPDVERSEAAALVDDLAKGMSSHQDAYRKAAHAIVELQAKLAEQQEILGQINRERGAAFTRAESLMNKHDLPRTVTKPFTRLKSSRLDAAGGLKHGTPDPRDLQVAWSSGYMATTTYVDKQEA